MVVNVYLTDPTCALTVDVLNTPVLFVNTGMRLLLQH